MRKHALVVAVVLFAGQVSAEPLFSPTPHMLVSFPLFDLVRAQPQAAAGGGGSFGGGTITNPILAPNGTACTSVPYSFSGDPDTGMLWDNANSASNVVWCLNNTATFRLASSMTGASTTSNAMRFTFTMPSTLSATTRAVAYQVTGAGSSAQFNAAFGAEYLAGYTGSSTNAAGDFRNANAGTGTAVVTTAGGNYGAVGLSTATTTGSNAGLVGWAQGGNVNHGIVGISTTVKASAANVGVTGFALNSGGTPVGGWFALQGSTPTYVSAALVADNAAVAAPILILRDNNVTVYEVADGGVHRSEVTRTLTDAAAATVIVLTLGDDTNAGGTLEFCVHAADATTRQTTCGALAFTGVDVTAGAGGEACTSGLTGTNVSAVSAGTLTVTTASTTGTDLCNVQITADTSIVTPTLLQLRYRPLSLGTLAVTPQ